MQSITSARPATFGLLPEPERNPSSLITSCILNSAILILLIVFGTVAHEEIQMRKMEATQIVFPTTLPQNTVRLKLPLTPKINLPVKPMLAKLEHPKVKVPLLEPKPEPKLPVMKETITPERISANKPVVVLAPQPKLALAAAPALAAQTAPSVMPIHFGDMNGAKPDPNTTRSTNIAALGNPYGVMHGTSAAPRGVVGSTGFGNGTHSGSNVGGNGAGGNGSYGEGNVAAAGLPSASATGTASTIAAITEPRDTPPVLISHAEPLYTSEARELKIQGEVVLRVTITVGGSMQVLGIVRSLGHGLDQSALQSAPTYHFQPATRYGQPVEYTTNLIIKFQTA